MRRQMTVRTTDVGNGKMTTEIEEGKCVKTIVLTNPSRRESGAAKSVEMNARKYDADVMSPSVDFAR